MSEEIALASGDIAYAHGRAAYEAARRKAIEQALRELQAATLPEPNRSSHEDAWNRSRITLHTGRYYGPSGFAEPPIELCPDQVSETQVLDDMARRLETAERDSAALATGIRDALGKLNGWMAGGANYKERNDAAREMLRPLNAADHPGAALLAELTLARAERDKLRTAWEEMIPASRDGMSRAAIMRYRAKALGIVPTLCEECDTIHAPGTNTLCNR